MQSGPIYCYDPAVRKFTGKERDAESGLDYFGAGYYGSALGRFTSPDWSAKPEGIPYADLSNPQSLNLYDYMRNNPLRGVDPDGHCCEEEQEPREEVERDEAEMGEVDTAVRNRQAASARQELLKTMTPGQLDKVNEVIAKALDPKLDGRRAEFQSAAKDFESKSEPVGPYKRPNNATTKAQRESVQGQPCATCGATGQKNNADHIDPLVDQHYRGGIDKDAMRSPGAVRPQCQSCSNQQGGYLRTFSDALKKLLGF